MPSLPHEIPLQALRDDPALIVRLLRDALDVAVPAHDAVEIAPAEISRIVPPSYAPDLVVRLHRRGRVVCVVVVEVQSRSKRRKRWRWPLYAAAQHAAEQVTTLLVVLARSEAVATWAARPITTLQPWAPFVPLVLGPSQIPVVCDPAQARAAPELALLSALVHGDREPRTVAALFVAVDALPEERGMLYADLIVKALGRKAEAVLEVVMQLGGRDYEFKSKLLRNAFAKGRAQGVTEGRAEGEVAALRLALTELLAARGVALEREDHARIESTTDSEQLRRWIVRAAGARDVAEVFKEP